jgi:hypothetical protein
MATVFTRRDCLAALGSAAALSASGAALHAGSFARDEMQSDSASASREGSFDPFQIAPGRKQFGYINVINSPAVRIDMPVCVVNGVSTGPTFVVTGGLYPTEYAGVEAAARLYQALQPSDLTGRVVIVPVVNMPCLQFRTPWLNLTQSISPMDGANINNVFPGSPDGTVTRVVADKLFSGIILKSNYHVDLRGGDLNESHLVHTIFPRIGQDVDKVSEAMAKVVGYEYVLPGTPDISHTGKGTLVYETVTRGIPSIITESGLGYETQPQEKHIALHVDGVMNILRHLGIVKGLPTRPAHQRFLDMTWHRVRTPVSGIFQAIADQGDLLEKGRLIGRITDLDGSELGRLTSPIDGVVHTMFPRRVVYRGDNCYTLLEIGGPTGW